MTGLIIASAAVVIALIGLAFVQRNWLRTATTWDFLAETSDALAHNARMIPGLAGDVAEHEADAARYRAEAAKCRRRAWPFRDPDPQPDTTGGTP